MMDKDTIIVYETIVDAVNIANNALVSVRTGDTSAALSDLATAKSKLQTAADSLRGTRCITNHSHGKKIS